ncbi:MAG TPA: hypothetical protein VF551_06915, partial [Chthoniobacterales bacterium]
MRALPGVLGFAMPLRAVIVLILAIASAHGVILYRTGDPEENTTAPAGDLANSGWQYEGAWGGFLGTPIAPFFFVSAQHIGHQGDFVWNGVTYHVIAKYDDLQSDLSVLQVAEPFPFFARVYSRLDEVGKRIAEFGRGTQRGAPLAINGTPKGWAWGPGDGRMRWGENIVSGIYSFGPSNQLLIADFDQNGLANECHLSVGDSGGAAFINDGGTWKLAGINYAVDGPFYTDAAGGGKFDAALFDATGFYYQDASNPPHFSVVPAPGPAPTGFYASRISSKLGWIYSVIDPTGDVNGNARSNILDYAASLNAPAPDGPGLPTITTTAGAVSITYRRL